jgi:hypothetical protein
MKYTLTQLKKEIREVYGNPKEVSTVTINTICDNIEKNYGEYCMSKNDHVKLIRWASVTYS